jgi:acetate kinase
MSVENILVLNAGSATLKYAVYGSVREASPGTCLLRGQVELAAGGGEEAVRDALRDIARELNPFAIGAVGHRIVHGGAKFVASALIDDGVVAELRALQPLAPLHQALDSPWWLPRAQSDRWFPTWRRSITAFHASMPMVAQRFALPQVWFDRASAASASTDCPTSSLRRGSINWTLANRHGGVWLRILAVVRACVPCAAGAAWRPP